MKKIEDYLPLYIGSECIIGDLNWKSQNISPEDIAPYTDPEFGKPIRSTVTLHSIQAFSHKLHIILRPLSSMTEEEMIGLLKILFVNGAPEIEDDELDIEMFYWDNGLMVDGDIKVGANVTCRCFEGQLAIRECGSMFLFDEGGDLQRLTNVPQGIMYLLSRHFDLFNLIPEGLAIDATTIKNP